MWNAFKEMILPFTLDKSSLKFPNDNSIKKTFLLTPMNRKPDWSIRRMEKRESKQEKQKDARRLLHCHWMIISLKSKGSFNKN